MSAIEKLKSLQANVEERLRNTDMYGGEIDEMFNDITSELEAQKTCEWSMDDPEWGTYKTECGQFFNVMGGDLKDNSFKYCTYCGGGIDEPKDTI